MAKIKFMVPGDPHGKGRPCFVKKTGRAYTPKGTREYEGDIRRSYYLAGHGKLDCYVGVRVRAFFRIPKSWSKRKKQMAMDGDIRPGKPDVDNILKAVLDALNGIAYKDDQAVVYAMCDKWYNTQPFRPPRLEITLMKGKKYEPKKKKEKRAST